MRIWKVRREGSMPSQFYGETYDGFHFFGHYRHGHFTLGIAPTSEEDAIQACIHNPAISFDDGTGNGDMELERFLAILREQGPHCLTHYAYVANPARPDWKPLIDLLT